MKSISIAGRIIGAGHPCFIIAEAGVNHNGRLDLALELVDAAAGSGADAVKFQTFRAEKVVSDSAPRAEYQLSANDNSRSQLEMVRKLELDFDSFKRIAAHCSEKKIVFLSTPFDEESVDFLDGLGMAAFKVGSGDLTHHGHLRHIAGKGRPVLLSTGMADWEEIELSVRVLRAKGVEDIALFHCVSSYPAPPSDCNLRAIEELGKRYQVPAGWSDHTSGIHISLAAVALGACMIEKHLTLDKKMEGPDHLSSLEPGEMCRLVSQAREIEAAIGEAEKRLRPSEVNVSNVARRSLHAAKDLPKGQVISESDLISVRPGTGISPGRLSSLIGRPLRRAMKAGEMLREEDMDPL